MKKLNWLAITCAVLGISLNSYEAVNATAPAPGSTPVSTPSRRMTVQMTNTGELINGGKTFILEFLLTNHGDDIRTYQIRDDVSNSNQVAYDNLGNKCKVYAEMGGSDSNNAPLPGQTPVKVRVLVTGFSPQATSFSRITISGFCGYETCEGAAGDYIFKNIWIPR